MTSLHPMDEAEAEDREADTMDCPFCGGSGYAGSIMRPIDPDTKFCKACEGEGTISAERLADIESGTPPDDGDRGDWLYEQRKDREINR